MGSRRLFVLRREADVSGVSGVGDVAEGVVFSDGTTVLRWNRAGGSTAVYDSLDRMEAIHGHDGRTAVVFQAATEEPGLRVSDIERALRAITGETPGFLAEVDQENTDENLALLARSIRSAALARQEARDGE